MSAVPSNLSTPTLHPLFPGVKGGGEAERAGGGAPSVHWRARGGSGGGAGGGEHAAGAASSAWAHSFEFRI